MTTEFFGPVLRGEYRRILYAVANGEPLKKAAEERGVVYQSLYRFESNRGIPLSYTAKYLGILHSHGIDNEHTKRTAEYLERGLKELERAYAEVQKLLIKNGRFSKRYGPWPEQVEGGKSVQTG